MGIKLAEDEIKSGAPLTVPMHIRNAPTKLMKDEGYGDGYQYPHSYKGHFIKEKYFPDEMEPKVFYKPGDFGKEKKFKEYLMNIWKERYKDK